jgi:hypothetical protein
MKKPSGYLDSGQGFKHQTPDYKTGCDSLNNGHVHVCVMVKYICMHTHNACTTHDSII